MRRLPTARACDRWTPRAPACRSAPRVIPWEQLDRAEGSGGGPPLHLMRRGEEYVIRLGSLALMSSRAHGSEESLAELACAALGERAGVRVLVGGLGMGFTLAAALRVLAADARVLVAELFPAVIAWNRGPLAHLAGRPLADPRAEVIEGDVAATISAAKGAFDAILLDVDNGPAGLTRPGNDRLYSADGLRAGARALRPGGVLGVWSVQPDREFAQRMAAADFAVDERIVRARGTRGGRHTLWLGRRPGGR